MSWRNRCPVCNKASDLTPCSGCGVLKYCGDACKTKHAPIHERSCAPLGQLERGEATGYVKVTLNPGNPDMKPAAGKTMIMHYTGTLPTGEKFDSSVDKGRTFKFPLGQGRVIRGWDRGVAEMTKGEKALLICAPDHAYGPGGIPGVIPQNCPLIFEVELIDYE